MIVDCISDLHGHYPSLEGGDLLIVAGDLTSSDSIQSHDIFFDWFALQEYKKKIYIAGNHDNLIFSKKRSTPKYCDAIYLCDSGTEFSYTIDGLPEEDEGFLPSGKRTLKIWGSPWTKRFKGMNPKCMAFTVETEEELAEKWKLIPEDIDILVNHCPPYGIFDYVDCDPTGSKSLLLKISEIKPKLVIFGHIHEQHGRTQLSGDDWKTIFVNASHVNENYERVNKPIRVEL